jgi:hypothetical protein
MAKGVKHEKMNPEQARQLIRLVVDFEIENAPPRSAWLREMRQVKRLVEKSRLVPER